MRYRSDSRSSTADEDLARQTTYMTSSLRRHMLDVSSHSELGFVSNDFSHHFLRLCQPNCRLLTILPPSGHLSLSTYLLEIPLAVYHESPKSGRRFFRFRHCGFGRFQRDNIPRPNPRQRGLDSLRQSWTIGNRTSVGSWVDRVSPALHTN